LDSAPPKGGRAPNLVVLTGPGGVGKSALALRWFDTVLDRFPHGQLYAELTQSTGDPVAVEDVLGEFLRALGIAPDRVPARLSERTTLYRSVTAGRSIAVLLDDVFSAAQVRALLPASGSSVVAVTSRRALVGLLTEGASTIPVEPLAPAAATELIERHVGTDRLAPERPSAEELVGFCEGYPLALCVAAALIALRPRRPVADLVAALQNERQRLDVLSVDEDLSVRATFDLSYRSLSPRAVAAYHAVGRHPGVLVTADLVAAACRTSRADAVDALDDLVNARVLNEVDVHISRCHDLVRAHANGMSERMPAEQRDAMDDALMEWHLFVAQEAGRTVLPARQALDHEFTSRYAVPLEVASHDGALAWLERHRLDLAAVVRDAVRTGRYELAYKLGDALQCLFILHKHNGEAAEVNTLALEAAERLGDPDAETNMRKRLARVFLRTGQLDQVQLHVDQLLELAQRRGDRLGLASGLKTLGGLHSRRGEHEQATIAFEEATRLVRATGQDRSLALALIDLGRAQVELGRLDAAVDGLTESLMLLAGLDRPDPYNAARASTALARVHMNRGEPAPARRLLEDALVALTAIGADHELATTHETLADVLDVLADGEGARRHRERAAALRPGD
jgi:tetratricopeptide (TPR) repeat protein